MDKNLGPKYKLVNYQTYQYRSHFAVFQSVRVFLDHLVDQETWLCWAQLDDFLVKIRTILDHTRTRWNLVIKALPLNVWWIFVDHLGPFGTIEDHLRPY